MVSSKKTHCAYCQKKCSGNVLRYQDRYYHKPCFELEQTSSARALASQQEAQREALEAQQRRQQQQQQQQQQQFSAESSPAGSGGRDMGVAGTPPPGSPSGGGPPRYLNQRGRATTIDSRQQPAASGAHTSRAATLPSSRSAPSNGFLSGNGGGGGGAPQSTSSSKSPILLNGHQAATCAACRERISEGQALIALDLHWHVWCFKCAQCKTPLHGEYVAKEGRAYCEKDYQRLFGITCVYCKRYITGKVLQAGEAHHFHPSCARCSKCGDPFTPGEEMYLQGEVTWHPRCGPSAAGGANATSDPNAQQELQLRVPRGRSPSLSSRSRSASPFSYLSGGVAPRGRAASPAYADSETAGLGDLSRVYTISYLNADPNQGYLRRPVEPQAPKSPQFSRPTSLSRLGGSSRSQQYIYGASGGGGGSSVRERSVPRGMYSVLSGMRGSGGGGGSSVRARSPSMMNEEAIALSSYPSGQKPAPDSLAPVERDDFPAPPFPYPERHHHHHQHHHHQHHAHGHAHGQQHGARRETRRRQQQVGATRTGPPRPQSEVGGGAGNGHAPNGERASRPRSRELPLSGDDDDDNDDIDNDSSLSDSRGGADELEAGDEARDPRLRKEEEELSKIANGIGKIFLQTLKEREKLRAWKRANLDPRNASRTPSATRELPARLRYENPTNASPSRDLDRPRAWDELDEGEQSPTRTRSSLGRSTALSGVNGGTLVGAPATTTPSALSSSYGYKVVQSNRSTPRPGYGLAGAGGAGSGAGPVAAAANGTAPSGMAHSVSHTGDLSFAEQQRVAQTRAADLLGRSNGVANPLHGATQSGQSRAGSTRSLASSAHFRRSMPNVAQLQGGYAHHQQHPQRHPHNLDQPPKLYPYHLLATSNYRLPPGVDRCHLERHLSNEEFQYIFHCDRLDFYRLPEWKRNELKRRARLF